MMADQRIIDIECFKHAETDKAILISDNGDEEHAVWLPKSQIEIEGDQDDILTVTLPEWLAMEKGLI